MCGHRSGVYNALSADRMIRWSFDRVAMKRRDHRAGHFDSGM
jgi:hypothetical protein